jgi:hypothetical protein
MLLEPAVLESRPADREHNSATGCTGTLAIV